LVASSDPGFTAMMAGPLSLSESAMFRDYMVSASLLCAYAAMSSDRLTRPAVASGSTGD
jgi:hypothetical protein